MTDEGLKVDVNAFRDDLDHEVDVSKAMEIFRSKPEGPRDLRGQLGKAKGRLSYEELIKYTDEAIKGRFAGFPRLQELIGVERGNKVILVGGGASLNKTLSLIKKRKRLSKKVKVFTVNKSHDYLIKRNLIPDYHGMCDPGEWVSDYTTPRSGVRYLLAAQCHAKTLEKFLPHIRRTYIWHGDATYQEGSIRAYVDKVYPDKPQLFISGIAGTSTIGLMSIFMCVLLGFSECELHGFDSCFLPEQENLHAYSKPKPSAINSDITASSVGTGHTFRFASDPNMSRQAMEFGDMMTRLSEATMDGQPWPMTIKVNGTGVIPWLAWKDGNHVVHHADPSVFAQYEGVEHIDFRPDWAKSL